MHSVIFWPNRAATLTRTCRHRGGRTGPHSGHGAVPGPGHPTTQVGARTSRSGRSTSSPWWGRSRRLELGRARLAGRQLPGADVRDHRGLPPLLLAPHVQDQPRVPVRPRAARDDARAQQGVLWWAAHHRNHHKFSDEPEDMHSPRQRGFWWSHVQWILAPRNRRPTSIGSRTSRSTPSCAGSNRHDLFDRGRVGLRDLRASAARPRCSRATSSRSWSRGTSRSASTRSRTCGAAAATRPPMTRATTRCSRC